MAEQITTIMVIDRTHEMRIALGVLERKVIDARALFAARKAAVWGDRA